MRWNKFTLKTRSEVEDIVISTLAEAGVEGVEIEDKVPLTEQDKQRCLSIFFQTDRQMTGSLI